MKKFLIGAAMVPLLAAAANFVHASDAQLSRLSAPAAARDQVQAQLVDAWLRGVSAADEKQTLSLAPGIPQVHLDAPLPLRAPASRSSLHGRGRGGLRQGDFLTPRMLRGGAPAVHLRVMR